ncbi:EfeM/EfeO family lipoprotein [Dermabacteraceae bacterium TAE3-ERU27]|nr:EfeM/EfeO family lipoprotein [Dermabacteraceae bacterium TAE3-ERU27]
MRKPLMTASVLLLALGFSGCVDNGSSAKQAEGPLSVTITDTECKVSGNTAPSGKVVFKVTNEGTVPNEFEILAADKLQIMSEKENIGPGTSVELTTALGEGEYFTACKPNMVGALVGEAKFTVTKGEEVKISADQKKVEDAAVANYTAYVKDQTGTLLEKTKQFAQAYKSGDMDTARKLYPVARVFYERIEPTAEAFGVKEPGDLDVALDLRIQDLANDEHKQVTDPELLKQWTGWHRIEADLFAQDPAFKFQDEAARKAEADMLVKNTQALYDLVYDKVNGPNGKKFTVSLEDVTTGASGLLEEVALGKIVGEEETFSHTDLSDFQANLDGARVAYGNVKPLVEAKDPKLAEKIDAGFKEIQGMLDSHRNGEVDGVPTFVDYSTIAAVQKDAGVAPGDADYTAEQRKFSDAVNGLAENLAKVQGIVLH